MYISSWYYCLDNKSIVVNMFELVVHMSELVVARKERNNLITVYLLFIRLDNLHTCYRVWCIDFMDMLVFQGQHMFFVRHLVVNRNGKIRRCSIVWQFNLIDIWWDPCFWRLECPCTYYNQILVHMLFQYYLVSHNHDNHNKYHQLIWLIYLSYSYLTCTCHRRSLWNTGKEWNLVFHTLGSLYIILCPLSEFWSRMQLEYIVSNQLWECSHRVPSLVLYKHRNLRIDQYYYQWFELSTYKLNSCIGKSLVLTCMFYHLMVWYKVHKSYIHPFLSPI